MFSSWRGTVGLIKPTMRPGSLEELIRLLPGGIGVIPILQNIRAGTADEFETAIDAYHRNALKLADAGVDLIHHAGTPPFMMLGVKAEARLMKDWTRETGIPNFTVNQNITKALRKLGARRIVGASYSALQNTLTETYLTEAGFTVLAMEAIDVPFEQAGTISPHQVYAHVRRMVLAHPKAQAIYLQGNAWRLRSIVEKMEQDFGIPVIETGCALSWEIQQRLTIREPRDDCGRLLREMP